MRTFFLEEGGKKRIHKRNAAILSLSILLLAIVGMAYPMQEDTSFVEKTSKKLTPESNEVKKEVDSVEVNGISTQEASFVKNASAKRDGAYRSEMKYKATQVIQPSGTDPSRSIPIGTSFIGRLINGIDTREQNQFVRVLLPYGASFDRDRRIDKNSTIFGTVSYPGDGEKVYLRFNRVLFPDGKEFKIEGEALNSADYSPGLIGDEHDGTASRVFATMGLNMIAGISDVLVQKEALSASEPVTPKSNLRNGFYNGLEKATNQEVERRTAKATDDKVFVTIPAGKDVVVSLTETFKGQEMQ